MYYPLNDKAFVKMKVGSGSFPDGKLSLWYECKINDCANKDEWMNDN